MQRVFDGKGALRLRKFLSICICSTSFWRYAEYFSLIRCQKEAYTSASFFEFLLYSL